jgi:L-ascorbate metabolism protein UlaG (beta-lactamase superfamily)
MKTSDHFDGKQFFNYSKDYEARGFGDVLKWRMTSKVTPWPAKVECVSAKPDATVRGLRATMVNHATMLVQMSGVNLLTDPVWSERVSPFTFAGPTRHAPPGVALADLPRIDAILISHDHYDHCDISTLRTLNERDKPLIVAGLGMTPVLREAGIERVAELDWWESTHSGAVKIEFCPAQHWSSRGPFSRNTRLWGSFMLKTNEKTFYFAADTGFGPHFEMIHERHPTIHLAAIPIGAYEPRWFMRPQHMNPEDAVAAHIILAAQRSVGIHWGTWQLTDEGIDEPVAALAKLAPASFTPIRNGEAVDG